MANDDTSAYTLRFNEISGALEYSSGTNWNLTGITNSVTPGISQLTGDVTAGPGSGSQVATISAGAITNAKVNAAAAIAFSKLAALTSAHILVGDGSNIATDVPLSGDATLDNTGALTLATVNSDVGSFTNADVTVDAKGRITAVTNGTSSAIPNIVVHQNATEGADTTSSAPTATPFAVTITPSSNTAKIKVTFSGGFGSANPSVSGVRLKLFKDGSDLTPGSPIGSYFNQTDTAFVGVPVTFQYLDSPGDTSPHLYTVYIYNDDNTTEVRLNNGSGDPFASLIAEEVH